MLPKYGTLDEAKFHIKPLIRGLKVPTDEVNGVKELICNVKVREVKGEPTIYFLENMEYFEQRANVYGYSDDPVRFALLSRGALEFLRKIDWQPDVVHANDWHTAYLPNYLRTSYKNDKKLSNLACIQTIHNLYVQGSLDFNYLPPSEFDSGRGNVASFFSRRLTNQNALKRGILYSDIVNTVSQRYSREIMSPEYGHGLNELLKELRAKVFGVLNGIDYADFDPATDTMIKTNFSVKDLKNRRQNKIELQKEFDLPKNERVPILSMVGRLDSQKGLDLVTKVIEQVLEEYEVQLVVLGEGEHKYREFFTNLEKKYPKQVRTHLMANWQLPRKIFAGSDIFLLPSKFEPGGIVVIEAMRYGAVPVVRETGGLADIVSDFDMGTKEGNGFVFGKFNELAFFGALARALQAYEDTDIWQKIVISAMEADFSWETSARQYVDLYERAVDFHQEVLLENPAPAYQTTI
jgi:starch synthase